MSLFIKVLFSLQDEKRSCLFSTRWGSSRLWRGPWCPASPRRCRPQTSGNPAKQPRFREIYMNLLGVQPEYEMNYHICTILYRDWVELGPGIMPPNSIAMYLPCGCSRFYKTRGRRCCLLQRWCTRLRSRRQLQVQTLHQPISCEKRLNIAKKRSSRVFFNRLGLTLLVSDSLSSFSRRVWNLAACLPVREFPDVSVGTLPVGCLTGAQSPGLAQNLLEEGGLLSKILAHDIQTEQMPVNTWSGHVRARSVTKLQLYRYILKSYSVSYLTRGWKQEDQDEPLPHMLSLKRSVCLLMAACMSWRASTFCERDI